MRKGDGVTLGSYVAGFVGSIVPTFIAYILVVHHVLSGGWLIAAIVALAAVQLVVQLVCFLHLGHEPNPRWNLLMLGFAVLIIIIIAGGSLWIMYHLNYNMTTEHMNTYMRDHEGF